MGGGEGCDGVLGLPAVIAHRRATTAKSAGRSGDAAPNSGLDEDTV